MTAQSDAYEAEVRSALIGLMRTRSGHRKVWDREPLRGWATDLLSAREDAPGDAWVLLQRQLSDPTLDDPLILAAGWLLKLRGDAAEDVQRDTRRPVTEVLPDANHRSRPAKTVAARNLVAVACLERDADATSIVFERGPLRASIFQIGDGETRGEKLVAERLRQAAEDWFERESQLGTNDLSTVRETPSIASPDTAPAGVGGGPPSNIKPGPTPHRTAGGPRSTWRWLVGGGAAVLLVLVGVLIIPSLSVATHQPPGASGPTPSPSAPTPSSSPPLPPQVNHVPKVAPLPTPSGACPTPHDARAEQRAKLEVFWWCYGSAVNGAGEWDDKQFQLKMRLGITADPRGTVPVDIRTSTPSTIRLLIPYSKDLVWTPPPATAAAGDKPQCVYIDGVPYWSIPPNVNDDAQMGPDGGYNFASHWDPNDWGYTDGLLKPGNYIGDASHADAQSTPDARGRTSADLVFTLPASAIQAIYGVALFDTQQNPDASTWTLIGACEETAGCMTTDNQIAPSAF